MAHSRHGSNFLGYPSFQCHQVGLGGNQRKTKGTILSIVLLSKAKLPAKQTWLNNISIHPFKNLRFLVEPHKLMWSHSDYHHPHCRDDNCDDSLTDVLMVTSWQDFQLGLKSGRVTRKLSPCQRLERLQTCPTTWFLQIRIYMKIVPPELLRIWQVFVPETQPISSCLQKFSNMDSLKDFFQTIYMYQTL